MMHCVWKEVDDGVVCVSCGKHKPKPTRRNCTLSKGAGDKVARMTSAVGIKPCGGCNKRKRKLNKRYASEAFENARWIPAMQYLHVTREMIAQVPGDVSVIVGIPRSGMIGASYLATMLHLPLATLDGDEVKMVGGGSRTQHMQADMTMPLFFDDTVMSGHVIKQVRDSFPKAIFASAFANPLCGLQPDILGMPLAAPHLLEWNFMNSMFINNAGFDLDGVIVRNFTGEPLLLPRKQAVGAIITARPESERETTVELLADLGVSYKRLIMWQGEAMPGVDEVAEYKAKHVKEYGMDWYVESEPPLAELIAEKCDAWVICPTNGAIY